MENHVYIATSLDGFIARKNHSLDFLDEIENPEGSDFGYGEFFAGIDALVMGKNTFQKVLTFGEWPYDKPVYVVSNSMKELPAGLDTKAKIVSGTVAEILQTIHDDGHQQLYIDGGQTIGAFLSEDKIDEMTITRVPRLLGDGIRLFDTSNQDLQFEHIKTTTYDNGLVKSHYRRVR